MAIVACAVAIPAGVPQPRPIAPQQARQAANPESEQLSSGADDDLKASNSYGYGYYGGLGGIGGVGYSAIGYGGYGGYGGYVGYPYSYGGYYPYSSHSYYSCKLHESNWLGNIWIILRNILTAYPYYRGYGGYHGGYY